jgi:hypothetical protein
LWIAQETAESIESDILPPVKNFESLLLASGVCIHWGTRYDQARDRIQRLDDAAPPGFSTRNTSRVKPDRCSVARGGTHTTVREVKLSLSNESVSWKLRSTFRSEQDSSIPSDGSQPDADLKCVREPQQIAAADIEPVEFCVARPNLW